MGEIRYMHFVTLTMSGKCIKHVELVNSDENIINERPTYSWGTKGDNKAESLGAASVSANKDGHQIVKVEVPTEKEDINDRYEEFLKTLAVPEVKMKESRDAKTKLEDYYRLFRTRLVLSWMFSNALLIVAISSTQFTQYMETHNPSPDQAYNPYLTFIFWSVAGLSSVRFSGSTLYLFFRLFDLV